MNKKQLIVACVIALSVFSFTINKAEAKSGCCSRHGGVCGCTCCDGSPLSAKCAPYYPSCYGERPTYGEEYKPDAKVSEETVTQSDKNNEEPTNNSQIDKKEVVYVGSVNSNKYHYPWCIWAKKINSYNLVAFSSAKEARIKGYVPCKVCKPPSEDKKQ
jgi:hypothetical protein